MNTDGTTCPAGSTRVIEVVLPLKESLYSETSTLQPFISAILFVVMSTMLGWPLDWFSNVMSKTAVRLLVTMRGKLRKSSVTTPGACAPSVLSIVIVGSNVMTLSVTVFCCHRSLTMVPVDSAEKNFVRDSGSAIGNTFAPISVTVNLSVPVYHDGTL